MLEAPPDAPPGTRLRDRHRPLLPVEEVHGWGIYQRLRILPDLPLAKVRESGRFVKNQRIKPLADAGVRAPVEVLLATTRLVTGPLALELDAVVGDFEETRSKQNLHFFHIPLAVVRGTLPHLPEGTLLHPRYEHCTVYPFAFLSTDSVHALARMDAIERGLSQPGTSGLIELMQDKGATVSAPSSLLPPEGLPAIAEEAMPQQGVAMAARRELLDDGARMRLAVALGGLTDAEAAILAACMDRVEAAEGDVIVRQGDTGDALYVVEEGELDIVRRLQGSAPQVVDRIGPGDHFGEIAVITDGERLADVVAATPVVLRRLAKDDYVRHLAQLGDVRQQLTSTALERASRRARDVPT